MFTYGKSKAAKRLEEMLLELETINAEYAKKVKKKVGLVYHKYTLGLREFKNLEVTRENITFLWRDSFLDNIKNMKLPEVVKTHLANVIHAETRNSLRGKWLDDPQFSKALKKDIIAADKKREEEHRKYVTAKIDPS